MAYQFPRKTLKRRRDLAAAIVWTLKLDGDVRSASNATAILEERLIARGVEVPSRSILSLLLVDMAKPEWGALITRVPNGRRMQALLLNYDDESHLPPNPFPPPIPPEPVAEPEPVAAAAPPPAPAGGPVSPVVAPQSLSTARPPTDAELEAVVHGKSTELAPIDLREIEDFEPFAIPPELRDSSTVIDKLFVALGVINDAVIQCASSAPTTDESGVAERLNATLNDNQTLRRQRNEARETCRAYKANIEKLQKANLQLKSNYDTLVAATQGASKGGPDGYKQLARFAAERPRERGHF